MRFVVDRIEGDKAKIELESGEMITIPVILVKDAKEGDVVVLTIEQSRVDTHSIFEALRKKSDNNES